VAISESEAHDGGDYIQSVQCMRCRTVRSLACFVGMRWPAELSRATVRWQWVSDWKSA